MAVVKQLLDDMARLKMNVFHWHLTDDQGWRIEIRKYPLLTEVGARRDSTQVGWYEYNTYDGKPHEGFYTQAQIKENHRICCGASYHGRAGDRNHRR